MNLLRLIDWHSMTQIDSNLRMLTHLSLPKQTGWSLQTLIDSNLLKLTGSHSMKQIRLNLLRQID